MEPLHGGARREARSGCRHISSGCRGRGPQWQSGRTVPTRAPGICGILWHRQTQGIVRLQRIGIGVLNDHLSFRAESRSDSDRDISVFIFYAAVGSGVAFISRARYSSPLQQTSRLSMSFRPKWRNVSLCERCENPPTSISVPDASLLRRRLRHGFDSHACQILVRLQQILSCAFDDFQQVIH